MLVFVYGTLRRGYPNHSILEKSLFISDAHARGILYHLPQGYTVMIEGDDQVPGEVYEVDDNTLKEIDIMEDYYGDENNLYDRIKSEVHFTNGTTAKVYVYMYSRVKEALEKGIKIPGGNWSDFIETLSKIGKI